MKKQDGNKRKKSAILVLLLLLLVAVVGGYTYSRYMNSGSVSSTATIAKWAVKMEGKDLSTYTTDAPLEAALTFESNEYVDNGVIAPGSVGTYTVEIDPAGSQVAIDYAIAVDEVTGLTVPNAKFTVTGAKYWIGDVTGEGTVATVSEDGIVINQSLADVKANKKVTVKVMIEWVNDEANNETDTANGIAAETATVKTSITAKQHLKTDD